MGAVVIRLETAPQCGESPRIVAAVASPEEVLDFWLGAPIDSEQALFTNVKRWFQGGPAMDAEVIERFGVTVDAALAGALDPWAETPRGRLALIIVLDQLTRNCFRGSPRAYAGDAKAQALALEALERGFDESVQHLERIFLVMPLHHAEDIDLQRRCLAHARALASSLPPLLAVMGAMHLEQSEKYNDVIARFGRFPHRNTILGRTSTHEELAFLTDWPDRAPPSSMAGR